jgi:hypothetical protein
LWTRAQMPIEPKSTQKHSNSKVQHVTATLEQLGETLFQPERSSRMITVHDTTWLEVRPCQASPYTLWHMLRASPSAAAPARLIVLPDIHVHNCKRKGITGFMGPGSGST